MKKAFFIITILSPVLIFAQILTNSTPLNVTKTWSQQPSGYTYPIAIKVPLGPVPPNGFPVCILLHGNGGNGMAMVGQQASVLEDHVLIAPTGYQNSWDICSENSDAPDVEMVDDLVNLIQGYSNINANKIRILGSSNGGGLANRVFIENTNTGIDIVCAIVTQLNEPQYHSGDFYKPSTSTDSASPYCGYDVVANPLTTRKYLSICNTNDSIIPYLGGPSVVGVNFLSAQQATYIVAQHQGYTGSQLTSGTAVGTSSISEFSYLSGKVVHVVGDAAHGVNNAEKDYITSFFSDDTLVVTDTVVSGDTLTSGDTLVSGLENVTLDKIKIHPNPTNALVMLERTTAEPMPYLILNILGQQIVTGVSTAKMTRLNLTEFPANIYYLKMDNQSIKIIKQK